MSKLVNSAAGNSIFTINGTPISNTVQPDLKGGAIAGVSTSQLVNSNFVGYNPVTSNPYSPDYVGEENIMGVQIEEVHSPETKTNKTYKVRSVLTASGIRNDKYDSFNNEWDNGFPLERDDTEEIQLANASSTYPVDSAILGENRVTFKFGLPSPTTTALDG